ncbi:UDP-glucose 4-epimerase GalE [Vibrio splendidus]|uniref:UDP-glucose 4-epimerase n=1 Tax=Vibrio splendidus TaxID=29497 RepID=A0A2N7JJ27_VIBSP|nr:UDP-glucose 4-epimerase GalE [Vibrio splendidus]PMM40242.1 UDP-glucose 4-epimerase GalE [Vibrio splendidus]
MEGKILIVGGAGYIGSHTAKYFHAQGEEVIVFDNLSTGHRDFTLWGEFEEGDLSDITRLREVFEKHSICTVIHFAAHAYVGESVLEPEKYYRNNVVNTINLLMVMKEFGVNNIVFSSSCATYGQPTQVPIKEETQQLPLNPYGRTKLIAESILKDYQAAYGLNFIALRYFNASGADLDSEIGERHEPETHLIPNILAAAENNTQVKVFGDDYPTKDGSCIRDYIHVCDLASAHFLAYRHLLSGGISECINISSGTGYSIFDIVKESEKILGKKVDFLIEPRRAGDPAELVGTNTKAKDILGWQSEFSDLSTILSTAYKWLLKEKGKQ